MKRRRPANRFRSSSKRKACSLSAPYGAMKSLISRRLSHPTGHSRIRFIGHARVLLPQSVGFTISSLVTRTAREARLQMSDAVQWKEHFSSQKWNSADKLCQSLAEAESSTKGRPSQE